MKKILIAGGAMLTALCLSGAAFSAAAPFTLSSTTFKDGTMMPQKVGNMNLPGAANPNPNCVGQNVSPQLSWSGAPEGTKSYVLTMMDSEGNGGLGGSSHWVAYGIPANVTSFAEGEGSKASDNYVGGKSTQGGVGNYTGPCRPPGSVHHFTFRVTATDLDPKELPPGLTLPELEAKLSVPQGQPAHIKGAAVLFGLFVKP